MCIYSLKRANACVSSGCISKVSLAGTYCTMMHSRLAARRKYSHMCTPAVSSNRITCLWALSSPRARHSTFKISRMRIFVTHPFLRRHNIIFGGSVRCKLNIVFLGKMYSIPIRICGRRGCTLESSQIIATCVKPDLFCFRLTFCTTGLRRAVLLLKARSCFWLPFTPLLCGQCSVMRVSSRLMRSGERLLEAAVSSAIFHSDHAAVALKAMTLFNS